MKQSDTSPRADLIETNIEDKSTLNYGFKLQSVDRNLEQTVKLKLRKEDTILALLGTSAIIIGLAEQDQFFNQDNQGSMICDGLRLAVMLLSAVSCFMVIRRYRTLLHLQKIRQKFSQADTLVSSKLHRMMGLELLINIAHCPPGLDATFKAEMLNFYVTYSYNMIMTICLLFRIYLVIRLFSEYSKFMQQRSEMVLRWYGLEASTSFAVKGFIYENPLLSVAVIFAGASMFWSVLVMLFEEPDRHYGANYAKMKDMPSTTQSSSLDSFTNCLWMIFVTTTTGKLYVVGYGDYYPYTHIGRSIVMLACIIGNVYSGLMIMALQSKLDHTNEEAVSGIWIMWRSTYRKLQIYSAKVLGTAGRLYRLHRKFRMKYPEASLLHPIKIYSKSNVPKMTKVLMPLIKIFNRSAMSNFDQIVLKYGDFKHKLGLYLLMRQSMYKLKSVLRDKRIEDSSTHILHNLTYQQALGYNDLSIKLNKAINYRTLNKYRNFMILSKTLLDKARGAQKISEKLIKVKSHPKFRVTTEVMAIKHRIMKAVKATMELADHKESEEQQDKMNTFKTLSLAEKSKIKKMKNVGNIALRAMNKFKELALQRETRKGDMNSATLRTEDSVVRGKDASSDSNFAEAAGHFYKGPTDIVPQEKPVSVQKKKSSPKEAVHYLHSAYEVVPLDSDYELKSWDLLDSISGNQSMVFDVRTKPASNSSNTDTKTRRESETSQQSGHDSSPTSSKKQLIRRKANRASTDDNIDNSPIRFSKKKLLSGLSPFANSHGPSVSTQSVRTAEYNSYTSNKNKGRIQPIPSMEDLSSPNSEEAPKSYVEARHIEVRKRLQDIQIAMQ